MNRKLSTRNAELDLQLTNHGKYINELLGNNNKLEQALAVISMKSAEELMHTSTEWSVSFGALRQHMVYFNGINGAISDRVWFNGKFNHNTGEVVDVRIGRRTDTDSTDNSRMTP